MSDVVDIGEPDPTVTRQAGTPASVSNTRAAFDLAPKIIRLQEQLCRMRPKNIPPEKWLRMPNSGTPQIQVRYVQNMLKPNFAAIRELRTQHVRNNLLNDNLKYDFGKFLHFLEQWPALETAPPGPAPAAPVRSARPSAPAAPSMNGKAPMDLTRQQQLLRNFEKAQVELCGYVQSSHVKKYLYSDEGADDKVGVNHYLALKFRPDAVGDQVCKAMEAIVTLRGKIMRDSGARFDSHGKTIAPGARVKCLTSSTYDVAFTEKEGDVLCKTGCGRQWVIRFDNIGGAPYVHRMIPTRLRVIAPRPVGLPANWWPPGVAPDGKLLMVPGAIINITNPALPSLAQKKGTLTRKMTADAWEFCVDGKYSTLGESRFMVIAPPPIQRAAADTESLSEILDRRPAAPARPETPDPAPPTRRWPRRARAPAAARLRLRSRGRVRGRHRRGAVQPEQSARPEWHRRRRLGGGHRRAPPRQSR